jgi:hypothetical protein
MIEEHRNRLIPSNAAWSFWLLIGTVSTDSLGGEHDQVGFDRGPVGI